jgi:hypothetical protein
MVCLCCEAPIALEKSRIRSQSVLDQVCQDCVETGEALTQEIVRCEFCGVESCIPQEEYDAMYLFYVCEACLDQRS